MGEANPWAKVIKIKKTPVGFTPEAGGGSMELHNVPILFSLHFAP